MSQITTFQLNSTGELRAAAHAWNNLWARSNVETPVLQAELVAHAVETFHHSSRFTAVVVTEGETWRAALPLIIDRDIAGQPTGRLFSRHLVVDGFLFDSSKLDTEILGELVTGLRRLRIPRIWLENVPLSSTYWRLFGESLARHGISTTSKLGYVAGKVRIDQPWESYERNLPRNRRAELRRTTRRLNEVGDLTFTLVDECSKVSIAEVLAQGFALEDTGWKGENGSSVTKRGMLPFFIKQAMTLAKSGQLRLAFLELDQRPIAFGYMPFAKGVCSLVKYAYHAQFAKFGPGQLLLWEIMRHMFSRTDTYACLDMPGVLTAALADWANTEYQIGQYGLGFGVLGRSATILHRYLWS